MIVPFYAYTCKYAFIYIYIYIYIHKYICVCAYACVFTPIHINILIYLYTFTNRKAAGHCSMVRFKEECPPHRTDCHLGKKNREEALGRKKNRYETLRADCVEKGLICHVIPIEVGCRGFIGHSVISFLSKIGITACSLKVASNRLQTTAQYASS